jgi:hypothetical protein
MGGIENRFGQGLQEKSKKHAEKQSPTDMQV